MTWEEMKDHWRAIVVIIVATLALGWCFKLAHPVMDRAVGGADHLLDVPPAPVVMVFRDAEHAVTCWTTGTAMACLRDEHVEDWHEPSGERCP